DPRRRPRARARDNATAVKDRSLWLDEPAPAYPPLDSDTEADVCIVGGGITGLSAACHLRAAAPALDVVVLERDEVGSGASGRSSGALTYIPERRWGDKLARDGIAETRRAAAFQRAGVDTVLRLVREGDIDCDRASPGYLLLGRERHLPYLRRELGAMKDFGQGGRFVDRAGLPPLLVQNYYAGPVEPPAHWVHPGRYVRGLARLAAGRGARLHEHATVDAFDSGRARLATGRSVRARTIVLATNGYTPRLGALRRRVFALHTAALTTEPLSPGVREAIGWPGGHVLFEAGRGGHTFVLTPDGRMLCRGTLHYRYADGVTAVDLDAVES